MSLLPPKWCFCVTIIVYTRYVISETEKYGARGATPTRSVVVELSGTRLGAEFSGCLPRPNEELPVSPMV